MDERFHVERIRDAAYLSTWDGLRANEEGEAYEVVGTSERSVQVEGELDGASVAIEGSNDGIHYHALTSPPGLSLAFRSVGIEAIAEVTRYLRPRVIGGDLGTHLTITILVRASR